MNIDLSNCTIEEKIELFNILKTDPELKQIIDEWLVERFVLANTDFLIRLERLEKHTGVRK